MFNQSSRDAVAVRYRLNGQSARNRSLGVVSRASLKVAVVDAAEADVAVVAENLDKRVYLRNLAWCHLADRVHHVRHHGRVLHKSFVIAVENVEIVVEVAVARCVAAGKSISTLPPCVNLWYLGIYRCINLWLIYS